MLPSVCCRLQGRERQYVSPKRRYTAARLHNVVQLKTTMSTVQHVETLCLVDISLPPDGCKCESCNQILFVSASVSVVSTEVGATWPVLGDYCL